MAIKDTILYFPMGAGGNLIRNIMCMDTRLEFSDDREFQGEYPTVKSRYKFLVDYYMIPVDSETWLKREWKIRTRLHTKYYVQNGIGYWNPDERVVYLVHGSLEELYSILIDNKPKSYDRTKINAGERDEQICPWSLQDCEHVFLTPNNIDYITEVYKSKNISLNQFDQNAGYTQRQQEAKEMNRLCAGRIEEMRLHLLKNNKSVYNYAAEDLFKDDGASIIFDLVEKLGLQIPEEYISNIHKIWLTSTKDLYYNTFKRDLTTL